MKSYDMTVSIGADKHCRASRRTLQVKSAAKRNTACKKYLCENFAKSRQMQAQIRVDEEDNLMMISATIVRYTARF